MTMQRVIVRAFGGPEQLALETMGQVLVDVEAACVNYLDVYQSKGVSPVSRPFTPGYEGVGRVREVGENVGLTSLSVGS